MADHDDGTSGSAAAGSAVEKSTAAEPSPGTAVAVADRIENPGFPAFRPRATDLGPEKAKRAERRVTTWFFLSIVGSVIAVTAYIVVPIVPGDMASVRFSNMYLGIGITLSLLAIGFGAVYWSKSLMDGHDLVEARHDTRGSDSARAGAVEVFRLANEESGFGRRALIRNSLIGALVLSPLPALVLFRDLAPGADPVPLLKHTLWDEGIRLAQDPDGTLIRASDVTIGSVFHVIPENLHDSEHVLEEKAKAAVLLMRMRPEDLNEDPARADWSYQGIIAYSKICTHVGCPVALYERQTHHLLCPCHQSEFDVANHARVIFGPAKRPLPQLPITIDSDGYLVARSDFTEPVGPSFWERKL